MSCVLFSVLFYEGKVVRWDRASSTGLPASDCMESGSALVFHEGTVLPNYALVLEASQGLCGLNTRTSLLPVSSG